MLAVQLRGPRRRNVALAALGLTVVGSSGGLSFALLQGWPLWAMTRSFPSGPTRRLTFQSLDAESGREAPGR
jgi:hypothetical protein